MPHTPPNQPLLFVRFLFLEEFVTAASLMSAASHALMQNNYEKNKNPSSFFVIDGFSLDLENLEINGNDRVVLIEDRIIA